jgi:hypothetical protein
MRTVVGRDLGPTMTTSPKGGAAAGGRAMTRAPVPPTRRALLLAIITIAALAMPAVLAGCGTDTMPTPGATGSGDAPSSGRGR